MSIRYRLFVLGALLLAGSLACKKTYNVAPLAPGTAPVSTPTPACFPFSTFGNTTVGSGGNQLEGFLVTTEYTLTQPAMVYSLALYIQLGLNQVRVAIYANNAGQPGALIVQSQAQQEQAGWNTVPIPATTLAPGNYWLAYQFPGSDTAATYYTGSPAPGLYASAASFGNFPATFPLTGASTYNADFSFYANYCPVVAATNTPTSTTTSCVNSQGTPCTPTFTPTPTGTPTLTGTATPSGTPTMTFTPTSTPTFNPATAGVSWVLATGSAAFPPRILHTSAVFQNKMWVIGGNTTLTAGTGHFANDVWSSSDGANWTAATTSAAFAGRQEHSTLVFNNKLWVIGGASASASFLNDVWSSSDGANWTEAVTNAAFAPRGGAACFVFNNMMWVGEGFYTDTSGGSATIYSDLWNSSDGVNWNYVINTYPVYYGVYASIPLVLNNTVYLTTGQYYNDNVWSSTNGTSWAVTTAPFSAREYGAGTVYFNQLWIAGGATSPATTLADVWSSPDGNTWTQATANAAFGDRVDFTMLTFNSEMWVIAGYAGYFIGPYLNDVWHSP
jgi:hypothetical protein